MSARRVVPRSPVPSRARKASSPYGGGVERVAGGGRIPTLTVSDFEKLQNRVAELERFVQQLSTALSVEPNGNVYIYGENVHIQARRSAFLSSDEVVLLEGGTSSQVQVGTTYVNVYGSEVKVEAFGKARFETPQLETTGTVTAQRMKADFVECDTIKANSVVGKSYTPGAGNIW